MLQQGHLLRQIDPSKRGGEIVNTPLMPLAYLRSHPHRDANVSSQRIKAANQRHLTGKAQLDLGQN